MAKKPRRRRHINLASRFAQPGPIQISGDAKASRCHLIAFGNGTLHEQEITNVKTINEYRTKFPILWVNVDGLGDTALIIELGKIFQLHALALEDVINQQQLAKCEDYGSSLFFVSRMLNLSPRLESEQLCLFLGKDFVVTFQEYPGDCFESVRDRIRKSKGRINSLGADYLAYSLLDSIVDSYFPVVDHIADELDAIEEKITTHQSREVLARVHRVRNDLLMSRRAIRPLRDAINQLIRDPSPLIQNETKLFLRDCFDHCQQLIELLETYRELCADMRDFQLSMVSYRMNEIMKVLTVIATIFMPLSFIASLYGMNFDTSLPGNMPELHWRYGYVYSLILMFLVSVGFLVYFWRKGWIFTGHVEGDGSKGNGST